MQVVVLAGGFGTRLRPWTNHVAKPLLPLLDRTLLERVVESLPDGTCGSLRSHLHWCAKSTVFPAGTLWKRLLANASAEPAAPSLLR